LEGGKGVLFLFLLVVVFLLTLLLDVIIIVVIKFGKLVATKRTNRCKAKLGYVVNFKQN
jgi:hypothetical protein